MDVIDCCVASTGRTTKRRQEQSRYRKEPTRPMILPLQTVMFSTSLTIPRYPAVIGRNMVGGTSKINTYTVFRPTRLFRTDQNPAIEPHHKHQPPDLNVLPKRHLAFRLRNLLLLLTGTIARNHIRCHHHIRGTYAKSTKGECIILATIADTRASVG